MNWDTVPFGNTDNVAVFWENFAHDQPDAWQQGRFLNDCARADCRRSRWIIPSYARGWDEHPPASVAVGMEIQEELMTALRESAAVGQLRLHVTYDEHGGYFDHVRPPQVDAWFSPGADPDVGDLAGRRPGTSSRPSTNWCRS